MKVMSDPRRLEQQVALVTGGAAGLGLAIARRFVAEGAQVVISDIQRECGVEVARQDGLHFIEQNVCDEAGWPRVIEEIDRRFGRLTILVNNAGIVGPTQQVDPENTLLVDWRRTFAVNVEGTFLGCRSAIPAMRSAGGGSIINISSVAALLATPDAAAYGASKAAVRQLTKSVAQYCAERKLNIRCNSLHPGMVRTELWESLAREQARLRNMSVEEMVREDQARVPLGDFTLPADVAAAAAFLASADSRHMTGAKLVVDGGLKYCDTYQAPKP